METLTRLSALLIILVLIGASPAQADIFGNGLVGWWRMDSSDISGASMFDKSGSGGTATINGSPAVSAGVMGQALRFNNSSQSLSVVGDSALGTITFTLSAWVRFDSVTGGWQAIMEHGRSGSNWYGMWRSGNDQNKFNLRAAGVSSDSTAVPGGIVANKWYFVTFDYNSGSLVGHFYLNGRLTDTLSLNNGTPTTEDFYIGGNSASEGFPGAIDDARVYNRVLTANEVQTLYYQGISSHFNWLW